MDYARRRQAIVNREGWEEYRETVRRQGSRPPSRQRPGRGGNRFLLILLLLLTAAVCLALLRKTGGPEPEEIQGNLPEYVTQDLLTENQWSRPGAALEQINGIVLHYVGNPGTSAQANRNYFNSLADGSQGIYASSHFIVGLAGEVIQCVPLTEIAYASNSRNDDTISVEVCHPNAEGEYSPETYRRVVELTAWLCREFHLDPQKDLIRHYDISGKLCPLYYVEHPEAWDRLRDDVEAELRAIAEED